MKLGISYPVFDGEELLEFAIEPIRDQLYHISVVYQIISYFGNAASPDLLPTLDNLKTAGLIDETIFYENDASIGPKANELIHRNLGLEASRKAGCSHHISADVDEFYDRHQLRYAKDVMGSGYDSSVASSLTYYKDPTYLITPNPDVMIPFIHPVDNHYDKDAHFPYHVEITRKPSRSHICKPFAADEMVIHHMSYVRKDMRRKFENSSNAKSVGIDRLMASFENYNVGGRVCLPPTFLNCRTIRVENRFGIRL